MIFHPQDNQNTPIDDENTPRQMNEISPKLEDFEIFN